MSRIRKPALAVLLCVWWVVVYGIMSVFDAPKIAFDLTDIIGLLALGVLYTVWTLE